MSLYEVRQLPAPAGSATEPSVAFLGDPNTGIYSPGADQVAISTGGTGRLFVDASGRVGVGTSNPTNALLHVSSPISAAAIKSEDTAGTGSFVRILGDAASQNLINWKTGTSLRFASSDDNYGSFAERMRIDSSGLVGIGTSTWNLNSISTKVGVRFSGTTGDGISLLSQQNTANQYIAVGTQYDNTNTNNGSQIRFGIDNDGDTYSMIAFATANGSTPSEKMRIDRLGRVGIGTTAPPAKLTVTSSVSGDGIRVNNTSYTAGAVARIGFQTVNEWDSTAVVAAVDAVQGSTGQTDTSLVFSTTGFFAALSERARIDSSGRLLVGTSSARSYASYGTAGVQNEATNFQQASLGLTNNENSSDGVAVMLGKTRGTSIGSNTIVSSGDVLGTVKFQGADGTALKTAAEINAFVDGTPGANDMPGRLVFSVNSGSPATVPAEAARFNKDGEFLVGYTSDNGAYKLQVNSQIFATSATIATSDGRYKENVATLDGCVDLVKALRPVSFDWKHQEPITRIDEDGKTVVVREAHNFPDGTQVGFIAQEVESVLAAKPWLGSVIKQNVRPAVTDNNGNELAPEEEFLGIAEGNLVAVLTSALKDAIGEIQSLKVRVAALESA